MSSTPRPARSARRRRPWAQHLRRAIGADHNPLCRPVDRARSRALLLAGIGVGLSAALAAGGALLNLDAAHRSADRIASHRHHVDAVVLSPAQQNTPLSVGGATGYQARATWTYPPGHRQTDLVDVPGRARPGSIALLWVSDSGRPAAAPPTESDLVADAACIGLFTLAGLSVLTGALLGTRRRCLDRRADNAWQNAWAKLEPTWSGRERAKPDTKDVRPE